MLGEKIFTAPTYRQVERKVDEWLSVNPQINIVFAFSKIPGRRGPACANNDFSMTVGFLGTEGTAETIAA